MGVQVIDVAIVHDALMREPVFYLDRGMPEAERSALFVEHEKAIAEHARNLHEVAILIALGRHESGFASAVIRGHCDTLPAGMRCDRGKARGVYELHRAACPEAYKFNEATPESINAETRCAIRHLRYFAAKGKEHAINPMVAAFAGYAARPFSWPGAEKRTETYRAILQRLRGANNGR